MTNDKKRSIENAVRSLIGLHVATLAQVEEHVTLLCKQLDLKAPTTLAAMKRLTTRRRDFELTNGQPMVDEMTFCVVWKGKVCPLGSTLTFRFFQKLAGSPNRYFSHEELIDSVWNGSVVTSSAIRGVAKRLRDQLVAADMGPLAVAVDGRNRGSYRFALPCDG